MQLSELPGIAITFVIIGVVVAIGLSIQTDVSNDVAECPPGGSFSESTGLCTNTTANENYSSVPLNVEYNASGEAMSGTAEVADKLPLIGLVVGFAVLLGILGQFLYNRFS